MFSGNTKNIVVIGAGLAGLVTIIECINNGRLNTDKFFNLHIVEKRSLDFNRRQKITSTNLNEFKYGPYPATYWQEFCENNFDPNGAIKRKFLNSLNGNENEYKKPINRREKFLFKLWRQVNNTFNEFRREPANKNFSIKELQLALYEHIQHSSVSNIQIVWHQPATVKSINANNNELILEDVNSKHHTLLKFDNIVIAEGSKGEVTEMINQTLGFPFKFKRFNFPILYHGSARVQLAAPLNQHHFLFRSSNNNSDFQAQFHNQYPKKLSNEELLIKFQALGYQSETLPNLFIVDDNYYKYKNGKANLRLFIASEIPKSIYSITDKNLKKQVVIAWSKLIAALAYNISDDYFVFDPTGETNDSSINALAFDNELKYVEMPVFKLSSTSYIYLIGDAAISNFYPLAFSSIIAATEASYVSKLVCNNNPACDSYAKLCNYYRVFVANKLPEFNGILNRNFQKEFELQQQSLKKNNISSV